MNRRDALIAGGVSFTTVALYFLLRGGKGNAIARAAESHVGWGATQDAKAFGEWLGGEGEEPAMALAMASAPESSTCGLAVRAEWRDAGISDPWLLPPYRPRIGHVIEDLITYSTSRGAWVSTEPGYASPNLLPVRGSMVAIGDQSGITHVYTATSVDGSSPGRANLTSVDGGQTDAEGGQLIGTRTRVWTLQGSTWIDSPAGAVTRIVYGWTDPEKL